MFFQLGMGLPASASGVVVSESVNRCQRERWICTRRTATTVCDLFTTYYYYYYDDDIILLFLAIIIIIIIIIIHYYFIINLLFIIIIYYTIILLLYASICNVVKCSIYNCILLHHHFLSF